MGIYCNGISIGLEMGYIYNFYNQQYLIGCVRNVKLPITDDILYIYIIILYDIINILGLQRVQYHIFRRTQMAHFFEGKQTTIY